MARIIDLSASLSNETTLPPTVTRKTEFTTFKHPGPGHWQASWASISVHSAAHVDSPLHVLEGTPVIGEIPLEKTIGELLVLDLPDKCDAGARISRADLERFDSEFREPVLTDVVAQVVTVCPPIMAEVVDGEPPRIQRAYVEGAFLRRLSARRCSARTIPNMQTRPTSTGPGALTLPQPGTSPPVPPAWSWR